MLKVGLTGGIGSGKSTIAKIFATLGIPIYDADKAAKALMNNNPDIKESIIKIFGPEAYIDNNLNRTFLASVVFNDNEALLKLNSLVHPFTINDANEWFKKQQTKYAIKEAALIFESNSHQYLDYTIGVTAPQKIRIKRTVERDNITANKVIKRMNKQMDEEEKIKKCNFVIDNSGKNSVLSQVLALHIQLNALASGLNH